MDRLQKKCVIVSTGMHLSLAAIIFVGPAFSSTKTPEPVCEIDFVPGILVSENVAKPPAGVAIRASMPSQPPPESKPQPKPPPEVVEPKARPEVKPPTLEPDDFSERKARKPQIDITPRTRPKTPAQKQNKPDDSQSQERQLNDARRKAAQELTRAATGIREGTAPTTAVDVESGNGGDGPAYASYDSWVQYVYKNAWVKPEDTSSDAPVAYATVTIASDGTVTPGSTRILTRSGDSQMDSSVQRTLDRVTTMGRPFPEGMKEKQRTYKLKFDLTKRTLT